MTKKEGIKINNTTGAIFDGEKLVVQQETWNGKDVSIVHLTKDEIIELAKRIQE